MAAQRSRRLRKKMHIDEFQELGFSVAFSFPEDTSGDTIDTTLDAFINEVIDPNGLAFPGRDHRRADRPDGQRSDRRGD